MPGAGQRCHVHILDLYFSKLPSDAHKKSAFYFRPKSGTPKEGPWYTSAPVGKNTLADMVCKMCAKAGLERKTNCSLWATATTVLFQANVPEKVIQERTGHQSLEALRMYEWSTEQQHSVASKILATNKSMDYKKAFFRCLPQNRSVGGPKRSWVAPILFPSTLVPCLAVPLTSFTINRLLPPTTSRRTKKQCLL